jgi:hypothetical protein
LNSLPEDYEKYVIVNRSGVPVSWANNIPMPAQSIMFLEISKYGKLKSKYLLPEDIGKIKIEKRGVILVIVENKEIFDKISATIPNGKWGKEKDFWVYRIDFQK